MILLGFTDGIPGMQTIFGVTSFGHTILQIDSIPFCSMDCLVNLDIGHWSPFDAPHKEMIFGQSMTASPLQHFAFYCDGTLYKIPCNSEGEKCVLVESISLQAFSSIYTVWIKVYLSSNAASFPMNYKDVDTFVDKWKNEHPHYYLIKNNYQDFVKDAAWEVLNVKLVTQADAIDLFAANFFWLSLTVVSKFFAFVVSIATAVVYLYARWLM